MMLGLALCTLVAGVLPAVAAYVGQLIVDGVLAAMEAYQASKAPSLWEAITPVLGLVALEGAIIALIALAERPRHARWHWSLKPSGCCNTISVDGHMVELIEREYRLATLFFSKVGELLSRAHLLELVWGIKGDVSTRTVDTHVSRLRRKLELDGRHGLRLRSIYQSGYRLETCQMTPVEKVAN